MSRRIWFHRTWNKYNGGTSGGQLKVFDAFSHAGHSSFKPVVYFPPQTKWFDNPGNFWLSMKEKGVDAWNPEEGDLIFLSGKDWMVLTEEQRRNPQVPIINIVQPRHVDLPDIRKEALEYPAIRIVKSRVAEKILKDYGVGDPFYYIPDAIDLDLLPDPGEKDIDIMIIGLKNPEMALRLKRIISGVLGPLGKRPKIHVQIPPKLPKRSDFLDLVNRSKLAVFLPLPVGKGGEGFYLPALEAMAMKTFVICPDVIGNRDFCINGRTCLVPKYNLVSIMYAVLRYYRMSDSAKETILNGATNIVSNHLISRERASYIELIENAYDIWKDNFGSHGALS